MKREVKVVKIRDIEVGRGNYLIIAGPCVIEGEEFTFNIAKELKRITGDFGFPLLFKASYDKANRTSINSYRGPGLKEGIRILKEIKEKLNIPVITDVHCKFDVEEVAKVADCLQIPAFLARQTDLVLTAAKSFLPINIKKPQFLAPEDMRFIIEKIESVGNKDIFLCERGTSFGYHNLVVDFRSLVKLRKFNYPVIFDATHSVQLPSSKNGSSGGEAEYVPYLARAAAAVGCDGIFMEVHPNPALASSDKYSQIDLSTFSSILKDLSSILSVLK